MPVKPVVAYPNTILRKEARAVDEVTEGVLKLVKDLEDTMDAATGAGIAAPQIGTELRIFVINKNLSKTENHMVFINPVLESSSQESQQNIEGCLSFFNVFHPIRRSKSCTISYTDIAGERQEITVEGYYAQAVLHELDHLDGKLFIDKMSVLKREMIRRHSKKLAGKFFDYRQREAECSTPQEAAEQPSSNS